MSFMPLRTPCGPGPFLACAWFAVPTCRPVISDGRAAEPRVLKSAPTSGASLAISELVQPLFYGSEGASVDKPLRDPRTPGICETVGLSGSGSGGYVIRRKLCSGLAPPSCDPSAISISNRTGALRAGIDVERSSDGPCCGAAKAVAKVKAKPSCCDGGACCPGPCCE